MNCLTIAFYSDDQDDDYSEKESIFLYPKRQKLNV